MDYPNILLITVDALRADYIGCYNGDRSALTPYLAELADDSIVFENAIAQGTYTRSSVPSFFTSTYPKRRFGKDLGDINENTNLAEALKKYEYNTAFFHSNPYLTRSLGYNHGFDLFDDSLLPWDLDISPRVNKKIGKAFRLIRKTPYLPAKSLNSKVLSAFENLNSPWFIWVHYMDTHGPFQPKKGFSYLNKFKAEKVWHKAVNKPGEMTKGEIEYLINAYEEEIGYTDKHIEKLTKSIGGQEENTLTVITADHGEQFGEHGEFSHGNEPYEELIRVPLLMNMPEYKDNKLFSEPVALLDIFPTILDILQADKTNYNLDGLSLLPLIQGKENETARDYIITSPNPEYVSLRSQKWKYLALSSNRELYNLESDPSEKNNLVDIKSDIAEKYEKRLQDYLEDVESSAIGKDETLTHGNKEKRERLEDLGYL